MLRSVDEDTFALKGLETRDDQIGRNRTMTGIWLWTLHPGTVLVAVTLLDDSVFGQDRFH